jgi:hypothetical protein
MEIVKLGISEFTAFSTIKVNIGGGYEKSFAEELPRLMSELRLYILKSYFLCLNACRFDCLQQKCKGGEQ